MKNFEIIKKALNKKHPCDPVHKAISELETDVTTLIMAWNDLPAELKRNEKLASIGEVVRVIGGA